MTGLSTYSSRLEQFKSAMIPFAEGQEWRSEFIFETLADESLFGDVADALEWYEKSVDAIQMNFEMIPLADCRQWKICPETGSMIHDSGEFFRVDGVRVYTSPTREVVGGWDQPVLTQVGYDGGILGLIRKRFDGVPHYLVEAKAEPGNYNIVQITTTVQATFSNLKRAHKGLSTPYSEYFVEPSQNNATVIFSKWMSEDGGRLFNKRNLTMLVEVPESFEIEKKNDFYRWMSLHQIKHILLNSDAIISPHLRGVISVV